MRPLRKVQTIMDKKLVIVAAVSFAAGSATTVTATLLAAQRTVKKQIKNETQTTPTESTPTVNA